MKSTKKLLSIFLAVVMIALTMSCLSVCVFAESGTVGSINWNYDRSTKTLTISGSGNMRDYSSYSNVPWHSVCDSDKCTTIVVQSGVTSIGKNAFSYLYSVTSVTLPNTLNSIGEKGLYGCRMKSIVIPEGVTTIGDSAFGFCRALESIVIPEGVTTIGSFAFYDCTALESVLIPASVESIGDYNFYFTGDYYDGEECPDLTIYYEGSESDWAEVVKGDLTFVCADDANDWYLYIPIVFGMAPVTLSASPAAGGTVTGGGQYAFGTDVTITATPNSGYAFTGWYRASGGSMELVSSSATYTFNMEYNSYSFTAMFATGRKVIVTAEPAEGGTVTGGGAYPIGTNVTFTATANPGYHFVGWYNLGNEVGTESSKLFTIGDASMNDIVLTAKFEKDPVSENPGSGDNDQTQPQQQGGSCPYCGENHTGFPGVLIGFIHRILALFGLHK